MRILMLTPRFPYPPHRGDTVRSWSVLEGLAQRHEVWLACVDCVVPDREHVDHVRRCCREVAVFTRSALGSLWRGGLSLLAGTSFTEGYFADARLEQTLRRWSQAVCFDAVLTYSSSIAPLSEAARAPRRVLDMCDVDSAKWAVYAARAAWPLSRFYRREACRVAQLEDRVTRAHDVCLVVNQRERRKLAARLPEAHIGILPTAVDVDEYEPQSALETLPREPVIGIVGSMSYPPNVAAVNWFGRQVWPLVRREVPAAQWMIVGRRPAWSVRRWSRRPGVTVTGCVPDVRPYLRSMRVVVNTVDNDIGVQSKLVVAMAAGRPAVITPQAAAGLVYDDPPPFVIAGSPTAFAAAVVRLLRDDAHAQALAQRARAAAEAHYSASRVVGQVECWLQGCTPHDTCAAVDETPSGALVTPLGWRAGHEMVPH